MNKRLITSIAVMTVGVILLIVFSIIMYKSINEPSALDANIRDLFYNTRGEKYGFSFWFFRIITEFGGIYFVALLGISTLIYTRFDYRVLILAGVLVLEFILNYVLKHSFNRQRPYEELRWMKDESSSFPSGHSGITFAYGVIVAYFVFRMDLKKYVKIIITACIALVLILVPVSRLVLGMHYFSDVVAGAGVGLFAGGAGILVAYFFEKYNILQKPLINFKKKEDNSDKE